MTREFVRGGERKNSPTISDLAFWFDVTAVHMADCNVVECMLCVTFQHVFGAEWMSYMYRRAEKARSRGVDLW